MWTPLTLEHLAAYLPAAQQALLETLQTTDPTVPQTLMNDVTAHIRGEIEHSGKYLLTVDAALLPPQLLRAAALLVVEALQARIPQLELGDAQKSAIAAAYALLPRVAEGDIHLTPPSDAQTGFTGPRTRVLTRRAQPLTADRLRGF
ncbi:MAG: hypothetical protein JW739_01540 [Opitutales bacterium]|nr:hypothetical protein [Opitutales bacterium]